MVFASIGEYEGALTLLERAYEIRDFNLSIHYSNPVFAPMRDDPRFRAIGRRMNLDPLPWERRTGVPR